LYPRASQAAAAEGRKSLLERTQQFSRK